MAGAYKTDFPLSRSIYLRAVHILNRLSPSIWQSEIGKLRQAMNDLIASEYAQELEKFSDEFAKELVNGERWEQCHLPDYLRDEYGAYHYDYDDARSLLENWPDPNRMPDGYPDQKLSDIEALDEILYLRRRDQGKQQPSEAQCYALLALEKIQLTELLFAKNSELSKSKDPTIADTLSAAVSAIEAMEMLCTAERKVFIEKMAPAAGDDARKIEAMMKGDAKRELAKSGAKSRWEKDPKTIAKQQAKECWDLWQANPKNYKSIAAFSRDMLSKFEILESSEVIQRWCREWQTVAASTVPTLPATS